MPFFSVSVHVLRPVPFTLVCFDTPGPESRKPFDFELSWTTIVYFPCGSVVTALPSSRSVMNTLPTVPCSTLPPVTLLGTSFAMFGSESMTPNSFAYFASWTSLSRSTTGLQIGSRTFCVPAGSSARISSGCACAYASDSLIASWNCFASCGFFCTQLSSAP